ncbi:hypothetical protein K4L06_13235 [Lysobacter sp. BMK333-48F3]|uniref:hypothetical protein n=1 Tax=Lysobacter sp. BMK333-48F3 TaxID=2867962 RepID=UPI001C8B47EA|nr:hypothetical protein [Lysobacter sp. BMK333-48F3]MBX9402272.1 hypothetical protein [Lysobacter sp. BMK333-48F3]
MHRLSHFDGVDWRPYRHPAHFVLPQQTGGAVVAGSPASDPALFLALVECLAPPYFLLYVLHTPRGEAQPGRYQSPPLSVEELRDWLGRYAGFLCADGRYDLWAHSPEQRATVVWDRHDRLYAYGPTDEYARRLRELGFSEGEVRIPAPHEHYYRSECDPDARDLIASLDWHHSPLQPQDEQ